MQYNNTALLSMKQKFLTQNLHITQCQVLNRIFLVLYSKLQNANHTRVLFGLGGGLRKFIFLIISIPKIDDRQIQGCIIYKSNICDCDVCLCTLFEFTYNVVPYSIYDTVTCNPFILGNVFYDWILYIFLWIFIFILMYYVFCKFKIDHLLTWLLFIIWARNKICVCLIFIFFILLMFFDVLCIQTNIFFLVFLVKF
eukprot:TRINITY_DN9436_c0_g1_i2.p2 TRINITY_DN9436_c0_g1~~TRINITY_DN9436_c0_g1_i2.p2  ORF type:complete len:197 (-),score=-7.58 TRINITY_DN9436_c0_g1_i2:133-723(-)